jgi:hypothetical protein
MQQTEAAELLIVWAELCLLEQCYGQIVMGWEGCLGAGILKLILGG